MKPSHLKRLGLQFVSLIILTSEVHPQVTFDVDTNFRTGIDRVYVSSALPLADGTVILSGQMRVPGFPTEKRTIKLDALGALDPSFNASSLGSGKLTAWNNDRTYVASITAVRRLLPDGQQDPDFIEMNSGPYFSSLQGGDYHVFPDGRVLMSGAHILSDTQRGFEGLYNLIWFSSQGYLDTTRIHRYCDEVIFAIEAQSDGKFLCSGTMHSYEDQPVQCIFRVQPDGALDTEFNADLQWGEAVAFATLDDGKILAGGSFKQIGSEDTLSLVRLMPDGVLDPTFELLYFKKSYRPDALYLVSGIMPMADGRMVVTGGFDRINGEVRGCVAILDANGHLLNDAFTGNGCDTILTENGITKSVRGITAAPDGSFYIYGGYHGYDDGTTNDTTQQMVSRLYGLGVGVQEHSNTMSTLNIYPNPAGNWVTLNVALVYEPTDAALIVQDLAGRTVQRIRVGSVIQTLLLDTRAFAPGAYTVQLMDKDTILSTQKLVIRQ